MMVSPVTADRPSETYQIPLKHKWNLFSIPVNETIPFERITIRNNSIDYNWTEAIRKGIIVGTVFDWNKETQNYLIIGGALEPGTAYWIWANYPCLILFQSNVTGDGFITQMTSQWNMIGLPYNVTLLKEQIIIFYNGTQYSWINATSTNNEENHALLLLYFYEWNSTTQMYNLGPVLAPGEGYWMYSFYNLTLRQPITLPQIMDYSSISVDTGDTFICNVSVSDPDGIHSVWMDYWYTNGSQGVEQMNNTGVGTYYEKALIIPSHSLEPLHYVIHARDTKTIWNSTEEHSLFVIDDDPPDITNILATPSTALQGASIKISCNVSDNIAVSQVNVLITYPDDSSGNITMQDGQYYTATYNMIGDYHYSILAWDTSNNINTSAVYVFTIEINSFTITASAGSGGFINPSGAVSVNYGDYQNFTIVPDSGYHIADVLVDDEPVDPVSWYNFTNVVSNHSISASFVVTNQAPTHNAPLLVSEYETNTTHESLYCLNQSTLDPEADTVTNTYHWLKNETSLTNLLFTCNTANTTVVNDYSGYGNHATVHGATWTSNGRVGGAINYNGIDNYIQAPDSSSLDGDGSWNGLTIEYWLYLNANQTSKTVIAKYGGTGVNERSYLMYISSIDQQTLWSGRTTR